ARRAVRGQGGGGEGARCAGGPALARLRNRDRPGRAALADGLRHGRRGGGRAGHHPLAPVAVPRRRHRLRDGGGRTVRGGGVMRGAWRVAQVRAAEEELMRRLPPDTLMHRAATGLARRCALLLADRYGGVYGRSVLLLVGGGNNGGDALFAGAALARRGV